MGVGVGIYIGLDTSNEDNPVSTLLDKFEFYLRPSSCYLWIQGYVTIHVYVYVTGVCCILVAFYSNVYYIYVWKLLAWNKCVSICRDNSGYGLSQWEMMLQSNVVSHWLSPYPEWSLVCIPRQGALLRPEYAHMIWWIPVYILRAYWCIVPSAILSSSFVPYINGLVQDCGNSSASAMKLLQSYTEPLLQYIPWNIHMVLLWFYY